ncbi:MAG: hypothetical protein ACQETH_06765 [Candidatus Rifleibacteriota bacterium]
MGNSNKNLQTVSVKPLQRSVSVEAHSKLHRTLASFSALMVNTYLIIAQKISPPYVELSLLFWLLFFVSTIIAIKEKDASYCFTPMVLATAPFIVWAAGLSISSVVAIIAVLVTLAFQRGVTMSSIASRATGLATNLNQNYIKRKILKLSQSDIEPELLLEDDLNEFTEVERELVKVKKNYDKSNEPIQRALKKTIAQVEQLQKDHARVMVRSAGLSAFLNSIDKDKIQKEIKNFEDTIEETEDEVTKEQLKATIKMKEKRIAELNRLETCLNRVKMQKIQMHEMFSSLMDKMNTLKFTDIMTLKASSNAMVKEVDDIRSGLEDLEKGLIEVEKYQKI